MKLNYFTFIIAILTFALSAAADTVTTKDGSVLNGTIKLIDKGMIHIDTPFAGKLKLKQEDIVSFKTDSPLVLRLSDGQIITGNVTETRKRTLKVTTENAYVETQTDQIAASWTPGKTDPEVERNRRKWKNNFAVDVNGRTGNVERFNLGAELDLRLKGPKDEIYFGFDYEQGEQDGDKTADRALGEASYERFSKGKIGWFNRTILETDPINGIALRSTTSSGISYRLINNEFQSLVIRGGLGYRYTEFEDDGLDNESTVTIDPGLRHTYKYKDLFYLENEINYSPAIDDFNNYTVVHDSSIRLPVGNDGSLWIRMGVRNDYESQTTANEQLDTNYYSQLIYNWK